MIRLWRVDWQVYMSEGHSSLRRQHFDTFRDAIRREQELRTLSAYSHVVTYSLTIPTTEGTDT